MSHLESARAGDLETLLRGAELRHHAVGVITGVSNVFSTEATAVAGSPSRHRPAKSKTLCVPNVGVSKIPC
jgi:hypothetical protein